MQLGLHNGLGSPDFIYTYRAGDDFFRGDGTTGDYMMGDKLNRAEFSKETPVKNRLPNLLDSGVKITNIKLNQGTATFDLNLDTVKYAGEDYKQSLLPQIQLNENPYSLK